MGSLEVHTSVEIFARLAKITGKGILQARILSLEPDGNLTILIGGSRIRAMARGLPLQKGDLIFLRVKKILKEPDRVILELVRQADRKASGSSSVVPLAFQTYPGEISHLLQFLSLFKEWKRPNPSKKGIMKTAERGGSSHGHNNKSSDTTPTRPTDELSDTEKPLQNIVFFSSHESEAGHVTGTGEEYEKGKFYSMVSQEQFSLYFRFDLKNTGRCAVWIYHSSVLPWTELSFAFENQEATSDVEQLKIDWIKILRDAVPELKNLHIRTIGMDDFHNIAEWRV